MQTQLNSNEKFKEYNKCKKRRYNAISRINEKVINSVTRNGPNHTSWHNEYRDSSYIYIGGLDLGLTEGDIVTVFSQWGEPIDVNLVRDSKTGFSKGYCFLCYEDQRSTILAVDNANEMKLLGRTLRVDHVKEYKPNTSNNSAYRLSGPEGGGVGVYGITQDVKQRYKRELLEINLKNSNNYKDDTEIYCRNKSIIYKKKRVRSLSRSPSQ